MTIKTRFRQFDDTLSGTPCTGAMKSALVAYAIETKKTLAECQREAISLFLERHGINISGDVIEIPLSAAEQSEVSILPVGDSQ